MVLTGINRFGEINGRIYISLVLSSVSIDPDHHVKKDCRRVLEKTVANE